MSCTCLWSLDTRSVCHTLIFCKGLHLTILFENHRKFFLMSMVWHLWRLYHITKTVNKTSLWTPNWMQYDFLALCQPFATANLIVLSLRCLVALAVKIVRFWVWQGAGKFCFWAWQGNKDQRQRCVGLSADLHHLSRLKLEQEEEKEEKEEKEKK